MTDDDTVLTKQNEVQLSAGTPGALRELDSRYEVLEAIGKGGMSIVYKARHKLMNTMVAIKVLQEKLIGDEQHMRRFQVEAKAAGRLDHNNLIKVLDFGVLADGSAYLVMDYAEGRSLSDIVRGEGALSIDAALDVFTQICSGIQHAHDKGVLHRDLKPSNVIVLNEDKRVKVVDFGIAKVVASEEGGFDPKLTATGEVFGSPYYMSPEQCMGQAVDARSDVYSMGCLMYEVVTGKLPLVGANLFETIHKQVSDKAEPLTKWVAGDKAEGLATIVEKTLAKNPGERYQSFADLSDDLKALASGQMPAKPKKKSSLPVGKIVAAVLVCSSVGVIYAVSSWKPAAPPPPAAPPAVPDVERPFAVTAAERVNAERQRWLTEGKVEIRDPDIVDNSFAQILAQFPNGTSIILQAQPRIDDIGMDGFKQHRGLAQLNLDGTNITDKTLEVLTTCPRLHKLTVSNTKITPDGFKYFAQMRGLNELWIADLNLTDADLEKLPVLPSVKHLKLDYNPRITDKGIATIANRFPNVDLLTVRWTGMSDESVPALVQMKKLRILRLWRNKLTVAGARALLVQNHTRCENGYANIPGTHIPDRDH